MTDDQAREFLQAAHSIIPSLEDLGAASFFVDEGPEFLSNEEAAKLSHPRDHQAFLAELQEFGKVGTLAVSYAASTFPFHIPHLSFVVSGYQTADGATRSFRSLKAEGFSELGYELGFELFDLDLPSSLGDDRIGAKMDAKKRATAIIIRFRRGRFINTLLVGFDLTVPVGQSLRNLISFAHLMDARTAQQLALSYPPIQKPEWGISDELKVGTRSNPVPLGTVKNLILEGRKHLGLSIVQAYRGDVAWSFIHEANRLNDPTPEDLEPLLLYVKVDYFEGPEEELLKLEKSDFKLVSRMQVLDHGIRVAEPFPEFRVAYFPGASGGGWMAWHTYVDDTDPLLVIGMDARGRGGLYFSTQP